MDNMTSQQLETHLFQRLGITILTNISIVTTFALLHGVFTLLFFISTASILRRGLASHSTRAVLLLTVISFITATTLLAADIAGLAIQVRSTLVDNTDVPLYERFDLTNHKAFHVQVVPVWATAILPIISDTVVIWRCWVVFFEIRWVMIGPLLLLLGTIANTAVYLALISNVNALSEATRNVASLPNTLSVVNLVLSLSTNALATGMIGYKLWTHRRFITKMLGPGRQYSRAQNVLVLLVESGVVYFALQLVVLVLTISPSVVVSGSTQDIAIDVFQNTYIELSAMYSTIVVLLVNNQRSFVDTCGFTNVDLNDPQTHDSRPAMVGHLSFRAALSTIASNGVLLEAQNPTGENATGIEPGVLAMQDGTMDLEKRQVTTAPF